MSVRPQTGMWRILLACTALSLLGVFSAFVDYGLSNGLLWSEEKSGFRQEVSRLAGSLFSAAARGKDPMPGDPGAQHLTAHADSEQVAPNIVVAAMTPVEAELQEIGDAVLPDISREIKADRLALAEVAVPKLIVPENEAVDEGASAALFLLSPAPMAPPSAPGNPAPVAAGSVAPPPPAPRLAPGPRNPFVTSATAASSPPPETYEWGDLVRMASKKGGNGEEPPALFGALSEKEFRARELRCMATAIYFEARGEPTRGQVAVGQVIMTRVRSDHYPKTICGVVFQGQWNKNSCQFSFACDGVTDAPKEKEQWTAALDVAKQVISGKTHIPEIAEATHYHAVYVRPRWMREVRRIKQIGVHIFYKAPYVNPLLADADYQTSDNQ